jgi:hypothetical protein
MALWLARLGDWIVALALGFCALCLASAALAGPPTQVAVTPSFADLRFNQTSSFSAFDCPPDANGNPDAGPDGVPGTNDDLCQPKQDASWNVSGPIGSLSNGTGPTTTLTASLPAGPPAVTGIVTASDGVSSADSFVSVTGPLVVTPAAALVSPALSYDITAFDCPVDVNGNPELGPDGVPGTVDDLCQENTSATWTTTGPIGSLQSTSGATTTLDPQLPLGLSVTSGQVIATVANGTAVSIITVQSSDVGPLVVIPAIVTTSGGALVGFVAYNCPLDAQGIPDVGPDGIPGSNDDLCQLDESVGWTVTASGGGGGSAPQSAGPAEPIGTVDPTTGSSTTFTPAAVPVGETRTGVVSATATAATALAGVTVDNPPSVPMLSPIALAILAAALIASARVGVFRR